MLCKLIVTILVDIALGLILNQAFEKLDFPIWLRVVIFVVLSVLSIWLILKGGSGSDGDAAT